MITAHLRSLQLVSVLLCFHFAAASDTLRINDADYFASPTLNVMVFDDYYPEGHQGGISIIQHGHRIATNGDLRLSRDPGQWQPVPAKLEREVIRDQQSIVAKLRFPDASKTMKGFNPMPDPGVDFTYQIEVVGISDGVEVRVHLDEAMPDSLAGKLRFNLEIFPTLVFGKSFVMDETTGLFPRQPNGTVLHQQDGRLEVSALATGHHFTLAPEDPLHRLTITSEATPMELLDGRARHNNGWFVLSSLLPEGAGQNALVWQIRGHADPHWAPPTTLLVSQVGYHPEQEKIAYVECAATIDPAHTDLVLERFNATEGWTVVMQQAPENWGSFLRYAYGRMDFSTVRTPGLYRLRYGAAESHAFQISQTLYDRHVWQPTVEYFLPVQMCHMRVNEKYRVWHDLCHEDDALMAPVNINHFDGYVQGPSTLTDFNPLEPVPHLNQGGWHDAGDYDLRVESQAGTVYALAQAWEQFRPDIDQTLVDYETQVVEIHHPDGKPDVLQQIEHGLITIVNGYETLGRLYRGIITPSLRQYVLLGDASAMSDGKVFEGETEPLLKQGVWYQQVTNAQTARMDPHELESEFSVVEPELDDRLVFTEENPYRSIEVGAALACAVRAMRGYDDALAERTLRVAEALWQSYHKSEGDRLWPSKTKLAAELAKTTGDSIYTTFLQEHRTQILASFERAGAAIALAVAVLDDPEFTSAATEKAREFAAQIQDLQQQTPFGVPYQPAIWGDGWKIQRFGMQQYFLHQCWPDLFPRENLFKALNFILGCHPGPNPASFVSGVGSTSVLTAYGINRADWSFIPGGAVSGTALIRPDFPELLEWPYLWQQTEYVMGGGATHFMFMAMAAQALLSE